MHIFTLAVFVMGMLFSSPAAHAFNDTGSLDCLTIDCGQIETSNNQGDNTDSSDESTSGMHLCSHSCHHTHLFGSDSNLTYSLHINKKTRHYFNSTVTASQPIYGLKRPPRIFA